jgi:hypothetical protein
VQAVEADGEVTERGHDLWAVTSQDLAVVLGEGHVPYPVERERKSSPGESHAERLVMPMWTRIPMQGRGFEHERSA